MLRDKYLQQIKSELSQEQLELIRTIIITAEIQGPTEHYSYEETVQHTLNYLASEFDG